MSNLKISAVFLGMLLLTGCTLNTSANVIKSVKDNALNSEDIALDKNVSQAMEILYVATRIKPEGINNLDSQSEKLRVGQAHRGSTDATAASVLAVGVAEDVMVGGVSGTLGSIGWVGLMAFNRDIHYLYRQPSFIRFDTVDESKSLQDNITLIQDDMVSSVIASMNDLKMKPKAHHSSSTTDDYVFIYRTDIEKCRIAENNIVNMTMEYFDTHFGCAILLPIPATGLYNGKIPFKQIPQGNHLIASRVDLYPKSFSDGIANIGEFGDWRVPVFLGVKSENSYFYMPSAFWLKNPEIWTTDKGFLKQSVKKGYISQYSKVVKLDGTFKELEFSTPL